MESDKKIESKVTSQHHEKIVQIIDGDTFTTSLIIAEMFGKEHKNVLQAINNVECSAKFIELNFQLSEYADSTGRSLPMYQLTRDGFAFLAMGFTGKKAAKWKETFIDAFNAMEQQLRSGQPRIEQTSQKLAKCEMPHVVSFLRGVAAYWAFVEKIPLSVAEFSMCTSLGIDRMDDIPREKANAAFQYFWHACNHPTYAKGNAAENEKVMLLRHMLTACSHFKCFRDVDFEADFEHLTSVKIQNLSTLAEHDIDKMLNVAGGLWHRSFQLTTDFLSYFTAEDGAAR